MRQVCFNERQEVVVTDVPVPTVSTGYVVIRTDYSIISSGTELAIANQQTVSGLSQQFSLAKKLGVSLQNEGLASTISRVRQRLQPPQSLQGSGYAASGTIIRVGEGIEDLCVGDRVACGGATANHAEIISVPRNLIVRVPASVHLRDACFTTLGAIAMQGVRRADLSFGETVVVTGLGVVGQLVSQLLQVAGCRVIAIELIDKRLSLARELGAHHLINASTEDPTKAVYQIAGDSGGDAVIVCAATGSDEPLNQAFQMCRERGRVIIVGDVGMNLERSHLYRKELDLFISRSYGPGRYDESYEQLGVDYPVGYVRWTENRNMAEFVRLLAAGEVSVGPLISAEYELEQAAKAYSDLATKPKDMMGVLFRYQNNESAPASSSIVHLKRTLPHAQAGARFAVIGAGSFAQGFHLPNLRRMPGCELVAVASASGVKARQVAEEFGASYCTTDYREVLTDEKVDAVIITTRHHLHAEMALAAIQNGKHVFVEKPLALTLEDCHKVSQAAARAGVLLSVGFNRRCAPLVSELKRLLDGTAGPKLLTCRVNAGWLPPNHWSIDSVQGGGRLLGEGCHFFDLLYYLVGAEPIRIGASIMRAEDGQSSDPANVSVQIEFAEGSLGTVLYTVVGHKEMSKERLEAFADGKAFVMDNYNKLEVYGTPTQKSPGTPGDKGHMQLLKNFCEAVLGTASLEVTAQDGVRATLCGLKALESIRTGVFVNLRPEELQSGELQEHTKKGLSLTNF